MSNIYYVIEAKTYGEVVFSGDKFEVAKYFNDTPDNIHRVNNRKSLYKNKYNILKFNEEDIGFKKNVEYAVSDVTQNEMVVYTGTKKEIRDMLDITSEAFDQCVIKDICANKKYKIFKIEEGDDE